MTNEFGSVLVTLRDQGIPLPAGAILISPWVDLTHSFPSVCGDGSLDYIPSHGFLHRPSPAWPPPNSDDMVALTEEAVNSDVLGAMGKDASEGSHMDLAPTRTSGLNDGSATET